ncbi:MAG TPA: hypothetical protein VKE69_06480 [Planctomycetota bacterium]|nr:hypothetical protein [Planctomycetota bacterium]
MTFGDSNGSVVRAGKPGGREFVRGAVVMKALLAASLAFALALPGCFILGRSSSSGDSSEPAGPEPMTSSVHERLVFDEDGWSQSFAVCPDALSFEVGAIRTTIPNLDFWIEDGGGQRRMLCPASLLRSDLPMLVVPGGCRMRVRRVGGQDASADVLFSGRLVATKNGTHGTR